MSVKLDKELILKRLTRFYSFWKSDPILSTVNAFILLKGKEDDTYSKSQSVQVWLTGHELPDTCFLMCKNGIHFLTSRKKADLLKVVENEKENADLPPIKIYTRDPSTHDKNNIEALVEAIKSCGVGNKVGMLGKCKTEGSFTDDIVKALQFHGIVRIDLTESIAQLLAVKEDKEIEFLQKSAEVCCTLLTKYARAEAIEAIERDRKIKHSRISAGCEEALKNKKFNLGLNEDHLDICYPAIIQSGGNYSLKFSAESADTSLKVGTMIFAIGVRYHNYCSNVIRTYLVNPTPSQTECYSFLFELHEFALREIKEGLKFSKLSDMIIAKVEKEKPSFSDNLVRTFGFVTGIEFRDSVMIINNKCHAMFSKNMSINLNIGLQDVEVTNENKKKAKESYWLGDILLVGRSSDGSGENRVLTKQCRAALSKISMTIKDEEDGEDEEKEENGGPDGPKRSRSSAAASDSTGILSRGQRSALLTQKTRNENNSEDERMKHQMELFERMLADVDGRFKGLKSNEASQKKMKSTISYKGLGQMPKEEDVRKLRVYVDKKYDTLIVPINGVAWPIHISTVKNVATSVAGDYTYLRVNLHHPGAPLSNKDNTNLPEMMAFHVKELTLRASNTRVAGEKEIPSANLNTAFRIVKDIQKRFKAREAEEREMEDLVEQDKLVCLPKPAARLKDVYMRPNVFGKRMMGNLETHQNGFRYVNIRGDKIDLLFNNIKHAFYQPCDSEIIILIHFHLKHGVMLNKKKHVDIQFYVEVGEATTDLDRVHGYSYRDRDDLESEHREREMRTHLKNAFQSFCDKASSSSREQVDFDTPFRDLGFHGAPYRSTVLLQPTSNCLVSLVEWPPFVVTLDEVEFFYFERVSLNIKTFDLVIVMKDYKQRPHLISSIPANSLEDIKNWINTNDIFYGEGMKSINWQKLLKSFSDDPEAFLESGGWSFLKPLDDDEENEDDDLGEDDEEFVPSGSSDDGGEDDSEDDSGDSSDSGEESSDWSAENESSSGSEELDSDESEGKDWDELEAIAKREDAQRERDENLHGSKRPEKKSRRDSPPPKRRK